MRTRPVAPPPRLQMTAIEKRFCATRALGGVELSVAAGSVVGLVGENGAGKSTLMKVLSGAHRADAGQMTLDGAAYAPRNPLDARRRGVAMIYQELSLAPHLSVAENILLGIEPTAGPFVRRRAAHATARRALDAVGLNDVDPQTPVGRLSIARQQLVEIARAVALDSKVLVLDEPTSSLTRRDIEKLFALVIALRERGMAVVYISHFLEEVRAVCDRYAVLRDGQSVGAGNVAQVSDAELIAQMVGREVADLYPRDPHPRGEAVLRARGVSGLKLPVGVDLTLHRGEVLGIAGLVGAGRTELLRTVFGLDRLKSGTLAVGGPAGEQTGPRSPAERWAHGTGLVSEDRKTEGLAVGLSIADNLTLSRLDGLGPGRLVLPSRQRRACAPWIARIPIKCSSAAAPVSSLSGGNQQKVAIARLLHADVDVLLLDEPTRGIDVGSKAQIYGLINQLALGTNADSATPPDGANHPASAAAPKAVLMVSSYLPELLGVCDRIAVMSRGRLSAARPVDQWNEPSLMQAMLGQPDPETTTQATDR